jgi:hypothetical protein
LDEQLKGVVMITHGLIETTPYRLCRLQLGHCSIMGPATHPAANSIALVVPLVQQRIVDEFIISKHLHPYATNNDSYADMCDYIWQQHHTAHDVFSIVTFEQTLCMWRHARSLPSGRQRTILISVLAATIRLTCPLLHPAHLRVKVPWLPQEQHKVILPFLRRAIMHSPIHPIIADFYCQHLVLVVGQWDSLGRTLINVYSKRKQLDLQPNKVGCSCSEFCRYMLKHGWEVPLVDGHAFFAGFQYQGPLSDVLSNVSLSNVPVPDFYTIKQVYCGVASDFLNMLGAHGSDMGALEYELHVITPQLGKAGAVPYARAKMLYMLLSNLCITPIDRNLRMAHFAACTCTILLLPLCLTHVRPPSMCMHPHACIGHGCWRGNGKGWRSCMSCNYVCAPQRLH